MEEAAFFLDDPFRRLQYFRAQRPVFRYDPLKSWIRGPATRRAMSAVCGAASHPKAGFGGEMKKPLAHRVTVPSTRIPSPAGETVAAIQDLRELDAAEARDGEECRRLHLDHDAAL